MDQRQEQVDPRFDHWQMGQPIDEMNERIDQLSQRVRELEVVTAKGYIKMIKACLLSFPRSNLHYSQTQSSSTTRCM